jgi:hypothetical protein
MHLPGQLLDYVVRPALAALNLPGNSRAEEMLVMGTAAKESGFDAIRQIGGGPALSLWQIEPATARDALERASPAALKGLMRFAGMGGGMAVIEDLPGNLYLGAALCRLIYYLKPFAMPTTPTPAALAYIWKQFYNSPQGAGTEAEFLESWRRFGLDALWPSAVAGGEKVT